MKGAIPGRTNQPNQKSPPRVSIEQTSHVVYRLDHNPARCIKGGGQPTQLLQHGYSPTQSVYWQETNYDIDAITQQNT